ncbi:FAD-binding protein [Actinomycetospora endophytica]|uniref:FAD-binding protein n=1 Tax=Actinomycetospora endophytica TaxID=2291215 RepID=A0ABS8PGD9_9PSEU|nr:FAD-binding protein [Actinomycetospora endophytica]MCD2197083.1 FAD-binding protein [Actinomycetospora endophytica]
MSTSTTAPTTTTELRDAVRDAPGPVVATGAGTAADWAAPPAPDATVISVRGLAGVVAHNPGDMTVAVGAGTPLDALQSALAEHGQRVAFDAARVRRGATVGGLFATADSGPLALAYGSLRDLVIGVTVVLADGTVARSGGHVIKNVAGYDLAKLLHGAHGTFGVMSEVVLRLHPRPPAVRTVALPCPDLAGLPAAGRAVTDTPVEPSALEWSDGRLLVRLEGTEGGVEGRATRLAGLLDGAAELPAADADAAWSSHADAVEGPDGRAVIRVGVRPTQLGEVLTSLVGEADAEDVTAAPATGVATLTVPADAEVVAAVHRRLAAAGGTSTLRSRPAGTDLPAWGPAPASAVLLRAVAASLDPDHRIGRGRMDPWLPRTGAPA